MNKRPKIPTINNTRWRDRNPYIKIRHNPPSIHTYLSESLSTRDIDMLMKAENELSDALISGDISLSVDGACYGHENSCEKFTHHSKWQRTWHDQLKNLFKIRMGIDTDNIPVTLIRDIYNNVPNKKKFEDDINKVLNHTGTYLGDILDSYPDDGDDEIMFDWAGSELCVIVWTIIVVLFWICCIA